MAGGGRKEVPQIDKELAAAGGFGRY